MDNARPVVRCIYAWPLSDGDYFVRRGNQDATCSLEEAEEYARLGFEIMIDYTTQEALARWEQLQRAAEWRRGFNQ